MLSIRSARLNDYSAYARLMPELGVPDPVPERDVWWSRQGERTRVAAIDDEVVGYLMYEQICGTFYVRNVVSDPRHRGIGVGRALMEDARKLARELGAVEWQLNVKDDNVPAIRLYESLGLSTFRAAHIVVFPWTSLERLPRPSSGLMVRVLEPAEDEVFEEVFGIVPGLLNLRRQAERVMLAAYEVTKPAGVAVFDASFPGAYPFCVTDAAAARALLDALIPYRVPIEDAMRPWRETSVQLALEDSAEAAESIIGAGAKLLFRTLGMRATL